MMQKLKIITTLLFLTILNTQCQNRRTEKNIDVSNSSIKIDSCGLYYKGQYLELGTSISEWEKVLGKPSRDTNLAFVWDDLGIAIDEDHKMIMKLRNKYLHNSASMDGVGMEPNKKYNLIDIDWSRKIIPG